MIRSADRTQRLRRSLDEGEGGSAVSLLLPYQPVILNACVFWGRCLTVYILCLAPDIKLRKLASGSSGVHN